MSTKHVDLSLDAVIEAAREAKQKNDARLQELEDRQASADEALTEDLEALGVVVRGVQQRHEDASESLQHDLAQARRMAGVAPVSEPEQVEGSQPDFPPAPPEPTEEEQEDLQVFQPPTEEPRSVSTPVETDEHKSRTVVERVQDFTVLQWVLAVIGAFIGLWIGVNTKIDGNATGFMAAVLNFFWCIGLVIGGFGLGGLIGHMLNERRGSTS